MAGVPAAAAPPPASLGPAHGAEDRSLRAIVARGRKRRLQARGATIALHKGESGKRKFGAARADWER